MELSGDNTDRMVGRNARFALQKASSTRGSQDALNVEGKLAAIAKELPAEQNATVAAQAMRW